MFPAGSEFLYSFFSVYSSLICEIQIAIWIFWCLRWTTKCHQALFVENLHCRVQFFIASFYNGTQPKFCLGVISLFYLKKKKSSSFIYLCSVNWVPIIFKLGFWPFHDVRQSTTGPVSFIGQPVLWYFHMCPPRRKTKAILCFNPDSGVTSVSFGLPVSSLSLCGET